MRTSLFSWILLLAMLIVATGCSSGSRRHAPVDDDTIALEGLALVLQDPLKGFLGKDGDLGLNGEEFEGDPIDGLFVVLSQGGEEIDRDEIRDGDFRLNFDVDKLTEGMDLTIGIEEGDGTLLAQIMGLPVGFVVDSGTGRTIDFNLMLLPDVEDPMNGSLVGLRAFLSFDNNVDVVIDNAVDRDGDNDPDAPGARQSYGDNYILFDFDFDGIFGGQGDMVFFGVERGIFDDDITDGYQNNPGLRDLSSVGNDSNNAVDHVRVDYLPSNKIRGNDEDEFSAILRVCVYLGADVSLLGAEVEIETDNGNLDGEGAGPVTVVIDPLDPRVQFLADGTVYIFLNHEFEAGTEGNVHTTAIAGNGEDDSVTLKISAPGAGDTPPQVFSANPNEGPSSGRTAVSVSGSGFEEGLRAYFNGVPATQVELDGPNGFNCRTPMGMPGDADIVVLNPNGQSGIGLDEYLFISSPTVYNVTPDDGPEAGLTDITISGDGFFGPVNVHFGLLQATNITMNSSSQIVCDAPANDPGPVNVTVTNGDGQHRILADGFTYLEIPVLVNTNPIAGPSAGGTPITITGSGFDSSMTTLSVGSNPLNGLTVVNNTTITGTTPGGSQGPADVFVETPAGSDTLTDFFHYFDLPTITGVNPLMGSTLGGTDITITGMNFTDGVLDTLTSASVGGLLLDNLFVVNSTTILGTTPALTAGFRSVTVNTPGGNDTFGMDFEAINPPSISSIFPVEGPTSGSTSLTITGGNFRSGPPDVYVGGVMAINVVFNSSSQLVCDTPANVSGLADVRVVNDDGQEDTLEDAFLYVGPPTVTGINPTSGSSSGNTAVTVTGTGFNTGSMTTAAVGGLQLTGLQILSNTTLTGNTQAHAEGLVDVVVTTTGGMDTLVNGYEYFDSPTISNLSATEGPTGGNTHVVITGTNFMGQGANTVLFGGSAAINVTVNNDTEIECDTTAHAAGNVSVVVQNGGGSSNAFNFFEYVAAPTVLSINPTAGPSSTATFVTITGTNFRNTGAGSTVLIGGAAVTGQTVVNSTTITCNTPASLSQTFANVQVTTVGGANTLTNGFQFVNPPTITNVNPATGSILGNTPVTVTGTNFVTGQTQVNFGGSAASSVVVQNSTTLTCNTPARPEGFANVQVVTPGGNDTLTNGFEFIDDVDVTNPTLSNLTLNRIEKRLNGQGKAGGTLQTGESGFTIDFECADEVDGSGINAAGVFISCNTTTTGAGGVTAGQNLFPSLQNTTVFDVDGEADPVPFASIQPNDIIEGVHITVPATVVFHQNEGETVTILTVRVSDKSGNFSSNATFTFRVKTRTNANRPFEQNVVWLIRFDRDVWNLNAVFNGGGTCTVNGYNASGPFSNDGTTLANGGLSTGANGIADFTEDLYMYGLISDPDIGGNNTVAVSGTGKNIQQIMLEIMKDKVIDYLQNFWYDGINNVEFRQDNTGLGTWPVQASIPIFTGVNYSQISVGGAPRNDEQNEGSLGTAFFDGATIAGTDPANGNHFNNFDRISGVNALLGEFPASLFVFFVNGAGQFRTDFDPLLNSAARHGGSGGPVGDVSMDALRVLQLYEEHTEQNFAAGEINDARTATIRNACDHLALNISRTLAHECGHSMSLVANGAQPAGLFGGDSGNFPSSSNHHINLTTNGPNPNGSALFVNPDSNIMAPASSYDAALAPGTRFSSHIMAYLKEQLIIDSAE